MIIYIGKYIRNFMNNSFKKKENEWEKHLFLKMKYLHISRRIEFFSFIHFMNELNMAMVLNDDDVLSSFFFNFIQYFLHVKQGVPISVSDITFHAFIPISLCNNGWSVKPLTSSVVRHAKWWKHPVLHPNSNDKQWNREMKWQQKSKQTKKSKENTKLLQVCMQIAIVGKIYVNVTIFAWANLIGKKK